MHYILSARNRAVLENFASSAVLVALDFDGTLAPITTDPGDATVRRLTRKLLSQLTSLYPCVVISGRRRADVRRRLARIHLAEVIGNHGIEPLDSSRTPAASAWIPVLKKRLAHFPGILIENKQFSVSVHYRKERKKKNALQSILRVARTLPGARLVGGKRVVNIVPEGAPNKGLALEREMHRQRCNVAIFVGDDETDEDVFSRARHSKILGIRVGAKATSLAHFYIRNQREIDNLLKRLISCRLPRSSR